MLQGYKQWNHEAQTKHIICPDCHIACCHAPNAKCQSIWRVGGCAARLEHGWMGGNESSVGGEHVTGMEVRITNRSNWYHWYQDMNYDRDQWWRQLPAADEPNKLHQISGDAVVKHLAPPTQPQPRNVACQTPHIGVWEGASNVREAVSSRLLRFHGDSHNRKLLTAQEISLLKRIMTTTQDPALAVPQ